MLHTFHTMKGAKSVLIAALILAFFPTLPVSYAGDTPEVIIFFDQSGSMKKYDPKLTSKVWLITLLRTFKTPHRVVFAGFDDEIHEYINIITRTEIEMQALVKEIEKVNASSFCTDMEVPFSYLFEYEGNEAIRLVLIISDGEPDIWDGRLRYFSKRVKSDPRYETLNSRYRALKASGLSPDELFDRLKHLYHERNLELIEEQVSRLKDGLGDRIVLWDLSAESGFLRSWAEKSGAQYLPMKAEEKVTPVDLLRYATLSVLRRPSRTVHEPPPQDRETGLESALPAALEPKPEIGLEDGPETGHIIATPQVALPESDHEPEKPAESIPKQVSGDSVGGWTIAAALALVALVSGACIIILHRSRKKHDQETLGNIASSLIKEASNYVSSYVDAEVRRAMGEAEKLWGELMEEGAKTLEFDKRFSIRTTVPPGAMEIHWTNKDGKKMCGQAVNISTDDVLFEAPGFSAESIDRIVCPHLNVVLNVKRSRIHRKDGDRAVAILEEFEGNVDDSMKWIEILTCIDEGKSTPSPVPAS